MQDQMHRMEAALVRIETMLHTLMNANSEKAKSVAAAKVRQDRYAETKRLREKGKVSLPDFHVLKRRDRRLSSKIPEWARVGLQFGAADKGVDGLFHLPPRQRPRSPAPPARPRAARERLRRPAWPSPHDRAALALCQVDGSPQR